MRRRLLLAVSVGLATAASVVVSAVPAHAHRGVCVLTKPSARLWPPYPGHCDGCCCRRRSVRFQPPGLAFRAYAQRNEYLQVRRWGRSGWLLFSDVRLVHEAYCRAAGI